MRARARPTLSGRSTVVDRPAAAAATMHCYSMRFESPIVITKEKLSSIIVVSLLIIVPIIKSSQCQHQHQPVTEPLLAVVANPRLQHINSGAAKHPNTNIITQVDYQRSRGQPTAIARVTTNNVSKTLRRNDLQQELANIELEQILQDQAEATAALNQQQQQQQQPKGARQLFITDFVSSQSHKLLKNFVNNTLADLVAASRQPPSIGINPLTRFIHHHQAANQLRLSQPDIGGGEQATAAGSTLNNLEQQQQLTGKPERPYLPTIGSKLYSFLFPNQAQQLKMKDPPFNQLADELIEPSPSDSMDFYESSNAGFGVRAATAKRGVNSPTAATTSGKFISLNAPYESDHVNNMPTTFDLTSNESNVRREKSNETLVAYPDEQQHFDSDVAEGSEEDPKSNSMVQEDSRPDIIQASAQQQSDEDDQVNMDPDNANQDGGEFKFAQDEQPTASNLVELEPHDLNHHLLEDQQQRQLHNSSSVSNHQMDSSFNGSAISEASTNTDSFFDHLPSTYDSPMSVPPDGYYDDYYKLAPSQTTTGYQSPLLESLIPDQPQHHQQLASNHNLDSSSFMAMIANDTRSELSNRANNGSSTIANQMDQFYLNQQPLRQNDVSSDQQVEFILPNRTTISTSHEVSPKKFNDSIAYSSVQQTHQLVSRQAENSTKKAQHSSEHDNIQVILANTNSSFDPISNEKIINYISENQNVTFQPSSAKSPRHTFVNKDMNELPTVTPDVYGGHHQNGSSFQEGVPMQVSGSHVTKTTTTTPSSYSMYDAGQYPKIVSSIREFQLPGRIFDLNKQSRQAPTEDSTSEIGNETDDDGGGGEPTYAPRIDYDAGSHANAVTRDDGADEAETFRRLNLEAGQNYGHYNRNSDNKQGLISTGNSHKSKPKNINDGSDRAPARKRVRESNRKRRQQNMRQQLTNRRPQVTQANFDPKDLVLSVPTPQPSVTESAVETITELPSKVKKLRENKPDKNELMNELLTALDRVKVAIYKLQPLTAKMNAIYRKSVTSNTRDTVLDNNKGTYAKRYPPGDYDDNYDRMHPSELLLSRTNPTASSRKSRRVPRTSPSHHPRRMLSGDDLAEESATIATYLPAPREMVESSLVNSTYVSDSLNIKTENEPESNLNSIDEIVATGIGRRMGDGRLEGEVVSFGLAGDDDDLRQKLADQFSDTVSESTNYQSLASAAPGAIDLDPSRTFGYRIRIYHSPEESYAEEDPQQMGEDDVKSSASELLSYSVDGSEGPVFNDNKEQDIMVTSESSLVEITDRDNITSVDSNEGETLTEAESKEAEKKSEKWEKKKEKKEKEGKKQEKAHKSQEKKKKGDEESKKKKEYKKIKHNKGLISKESKKMHRDKHVKSHDRGAAKEKALKERTQIEFFEREQIVDDEYEKGKKSTIKAGWQSGHEAKKSSKDISGGGGGDSMSMGGSHFVAHEQPVSFSEKGHGSSMESSSGKKSNKFEKKDMESKGKKFKGWREKGYKIVTETEFVDRGSLHDSAYKKRDKGAAHHKKYKKQEASSEGHHGSMHEHHKKSHKKEEKKEKMQEKHVKKGEGEEKKKETGEKDKKKKKMVEKGKREEADEGESMIAATIRPSDEIIELMNRNQRFKQPISIDSRAWQFTLNNMVDHQQQSPTLSRLLSVDHDLKPLSMFTEPDNKHQARPARQIPNVTSDHHELQQTMRRNSSSHEQNVSNTEGTIRRADFVSYNKVGVSTNQSPSNASALFDIVDNFTGQRMNKTRAGTYEVDDHTTKPIENSIQRDRLSAAQPTKIIVPDSRDSRQLSAGRPSQQLQNPMTTTTTTTTQKPKQTNRESLGGDRGSKAERNKLVSLLRAEQIARRQPEQSTGGGLTNQLNRLAIDTNHQQLIAQSNNYLYPAANRRQSNDMGIAAAQAYMQQLARGTSTAAASSIHFNNPSEMFDLSGINFGQPSDNLQASFLAQTPSLPMSASNYHRTSYFSPPAGQFEFGPPSSQLTKSVQFPHEQLVDYDADAILTPSLQNTFATD